MGRVVIAYARQLLDAPEHTTTIVSSTLFCPNNS